MYEGSSDDASEGGDGKDGNDAADDGDDDEKNDGDDDDDKEDGDDEWETEDEDDVIVESEDSKDNEEEVEDTATRLKTLMSTPSSPPTEQIPISLPKERMARKRSSDGRTEAMNQSGGRKETGATTRGKLIILPGPLAFQIPTEYDS